jgi:hypothetical protein
VRLSVPWHAEGPSDVGAGGSCFDVEYPCGHGCCQRGDGRGDDDADACNAAGDSVGDRGDDDDGGDGDRPESLRTIKYVDRVVGMTAPPTLTATIRVPVRTGREMTKSSRPHGPAPAGTRSRRASGQRDVAPAPRIDANKTVKATARRGRHGRRRRTRR